MNKFDIEEVNDLDKRNFVEIFGNAVESYKEAADAMYSKRPFQNAENMCQMFSDHLENLPLSDKLKILQLHPILAGKQAEKGKLTTESAEEQKAAKLNNLENEKKIELDSLNSQYIEKFGFPFVICAKENTATTIAEKLRERLQNDTTQEIITGINEVKKICRLRILNFVK